MAIAVRAQDIEADWNLRSRAGQRERRLAIDASGADIKLRRVRCGDARTTVQMKQRHACAFLFQRRNDDDIQRDAAPTRGCGIFRNHNRAASSGGLRQSRRARPRGKCRRGVRMRITPVTMTRSVNIFTVIEGLEPGRQRQQGPQQTPVLRSPPEIRRVPGAQVNSGGLKDSNAHERSPKPPEERRRGRPPRRRATLLESVSYEPENARTLRGPRTPPR
jgi:hypothetical protein